MSNVETLVARLREEAANDPRGDAPLGDLADALESALAADRRAEDRGGVVVDSRDGYAIKAPSGLVMMWTIRLNATAAEKAFHDGMEDREGDGDYVLVRVRVEEMPITTPTGATPR
jgi:hypothetical protein